MAISVAAYIHPRWFESDDDEDLRFLKQIGVDEVSVGLTAVKGYSRTRNLKQSDIDALVDRLDTIGLRIVRVSAGGQLRDAFLGKPEGQEQIDRLCRLTEVLGSAGVPGMYFGSFYAAQLVSMPAAESGAGFFPGQYAGELIASGRPGWSERAGRGGYVSPAYDHAAAQAVARDPKENVTFEELWDGLLNVYRQVMPVAESAGVFIAQHGNDPPASTMFGNPQILCTFADFGRLFAEVPSPNNGMTFCVGTRQSSGEDVLEGIRRFGGQNRIFHVHFRNVGGTLADDQAYHERMVDDGDLDMPSVLKALRDIGYNRAIDHDHVVRLSGESSFIGRDSVAFSVGYMKGLLAALTT